MVARGGTCTLYAGGLGMASWFYSVLLMVSANSDSDDVQLSHYKLEMRLTVYALAGTSYCMRDVAAGRFKTIEKIWGRAQATTAKSRGQVLHQHHSTIKS
jgi:hypothetical protein